VRQLAGFRRVRVEPGETVTVSFRLHTDDLGFYGRDQVRITEAGEFNVWIGGSSETELGANFRIIANG
jgi:beta-glucosidase